ncbi:YdcF family protein [Kibdelosporangium banguiense]|uniref:YdcF family protein n=1 Tax=Kibdelosporangium banguiense TaxID=1365924 RepID=UPI001AE5DBF5|nr:YdcF family protein [Kibdelosporangium banguiense]
MHRQVSDDEWADAELVWEYHQLHHCLQPCSAAIGLGCNDLGVATYAAELYHRGLFPIIVFSGATSRDTWGVFPRGEAVHYRERAMDLGVPAEAILVEPHATNTGDNITLSQMVLRSSGLRIDSLLLVSMPYMERRAYATCRQAWPEVTPICASAPLTFEEYVKVMGDSALVIDMMVGDLQRVMEYPKRGFAIAQEVPEQVQTAYKRLVSAGFTSRLLST